MSSDTKARRTATGTGTGTGDMTKATLTSRLFWHRLNDFSSAASNHVLNTSLNRTMMMILLTLTLTLTLPHSVSAVQSDISSDVVVSESTPANSNSSSSPSSFISDLDCQLMVAGVVVGFVGLQLWVWSFATLWKQRRALKQEGSDEPRGRTRQSSPPTGRGGLGGRFGAGPFGRSGGGGGGGFGGSARHMSLGRRGGDVGRRGSGAISD